VGLLCNERHSSVDDSLPIASLAIDQVCEDGIYTKGGLLNKICWIMAIFACFIFNDFVCLSHI
jgi:hypothetical protein